MKLRCRCTAIERCKQELDTLENSIALDISSSHESHSDISAALRLAAGSLGEAINTETITLVETDLKKVNKQSRQSVLSASDECASEVERLSYLLDEMRREDKAYHTALAEAEAAAKLNDR